MSTIKWGSLVFAQYQVSNEICKLGDRILLQNYHAPVVGSYEDHMDLCMHPMALHARGNPSQLVAMVPLSWQVKLVG